MWQVTVGHVARLSLADAHDFVQDPAAARAMCLQHLMARRTASVTPTPTASTAD
jgi:hypothetical protein